MIVELTKAAKRSRAFDSQVAYHEAGHAVVSWSLHLRVRRATIVPDAGAAGHVLGRRTHKNTRNDIEWADRFSPGRLTAEKHVMVSMAGELAQRKFAPHSWRSYHGAGDRETIADFLTRYAGCDHDGAIDIRAHYKLLREWTAEIIEREWYLIETVADSLIKCRTLSGKELTELILDAPDQRFGQPGSWRKLAKALSKGERKTQSTGAGFSRVRALAGRLRSIRWFGIVPIEKPCRIYRVGNRCFEHQMHQYIIPRSVHLIQWGKHRFAS